MIIQLNLFVSNRLNVQTFRLDADPQAAGMNAGTTTSVTFSANLRRGEFPER